MGLLRGTLVFAGVSAPVQGAVCHIRVQDVSRADAAAVVIAEATLTEVAAEADGAELPFELDVPELDRSATYTLAAHVDVTASGEVTSGDFLTTEHIPVSPDDLEKPRRVTARRI